MQTEKSTKVNIKTTKETAEESSDMQAEMLLMELGLMARSMAASYIPTQMVKRRERSIKTTRSKNKAADSNEL